MGMKLLKTIRKTEVALTKNKAKTYMGINAIGVIATAGVSFKSGMNIQKKIDDGTLEKKDILVEGVKVVGTVALTEFAGISSYRASAKTIAELTLGLTSAKKEYEALERKMRENLGEEKTDEIRKEAQKEVANEKAQETTSRMPEITGNFWWKDTFTGAYFYCRERDILNAWNYVSKRLYIGEKVSVSDFYYNLEREDQMYESYSMAKQFGWDGENSMERNCRIVLTGTEELPNGVPCRAIRYSDVPKFNKKFAAES